MNPRQRSILGYVAAFVALVSTPILYALGLLVLRPGLVIAVGVPSIFGRAAVVFGLQVRATGDSEWGTRIVLSGIAAFILVAVWGIQTVI